MIPPEVKSEFTFEKQGRGKVRVKGRVVVHHTRLAILATALLVGLALYLSMDAGERIANPAPPHARPLAPVPAPPTPAPTLTPASTSGQAGPEYLFQLLALGDQRVPVGATSVTSDAAIADIAVAVTPAPPRDVSLVALTQWEGYRPQRAVATRAPGDRTIFRLHAIRLRPPTSMKGSTTTMQVALASASSVNDVDRASAPVPGAATFEIRVPAPIVTMMSVCDEPLSRRLRCARLELAGTATHLLSGDDERVCIEASPISGAPQSPLLLYGATSANRERWSAVGPADEAPTAPGYVFRYALIQPRQAEERRGCGDTLVPLPMRPERLSTRNSGPGTDREE